MSINKIVRDVTSATISTAATDTQNFTLPSNCVYAEIQLFTTALATTTHYAEWQNAGDSAILRMAEWDDAGDHYIAGTPPGDASQIEVVGDNGSGANTTFRYVVTFHIKVRSLN